MEVKVKLWHKGKYQWFPGIAVEPREDGMWKVEYEDGEVAYDDPRDMVESKS
jgi:hypothetical protein